MVGLGVGGAAEDGREGRRGKKEREGERIVKNRHGSVIYKSGQTDSTSFYR